MNHRRLLIVIARIAPSKREPLEALPGGRATRLVTELARPVPCITVRQSSRFSRACIDRTRRQFGQFRVNEGRRYGPPRLPTEPLALQSRLCHRVYTIVLEWTDSSRASGRPLGGLEADRPGEI